MRSAATKQSAKVSQSLSPQESVWRRETHFCKDLVPAPMLIARQFQKSAIQLENCGMKHFDRTIISDQPAFRAIKHLGHYEDLEEFTSLGQRYLLIVV